MGRPFHLNRRPRTIKSTVLGLLLTQSSRTARRASESNTFTSSNAGPPIRDTRCRFPAKLLFRLATDLKGVRIYDFRSNQFERFENAHEQFLGPAMRLLSARSQLNYLPTRQSFSARLDESDQLYFL